MVVSMMWLIGKFELFVKLMLFLFWGLLFNGMLMLVRVLMIIMLELVIVVFMSLVGRLFLVVFEF